MLKLRYLNAADNRLWTTYAMCMRWALNVSSSHQSSKLIYGTLSKVVKLTSTVDKLHVLREREKYHVLE